jgi:hypothetical protein
MEYKEIKNPSLNLTFIHSFIPLLETPHFGMNAELKYGSQTTQPYKIYIFHLNAGEDSISFYTL